MAYENGRIPESALTTTYLYYPGTRNGRQLLAEIAPYAEAMATAFYVKFGKPLYATDGYRDYATQVQLKKEKGPYAATPGTSNHGWGRALDLASGVNSFSSDEHRWLRANAHRWGFAHPEWAHNGVSADGMDEAWHWEFVGGGSSEYRVKRPGKGQLGLGATGTAVREVQELLNDRGYRVAVDGDYGLGTAVAVLKFQAARGLTRDGIAGDRTLAALRPRKYHTRVTTRATHVHKVPGRQHEGRLLPEGYRFTVWDGAAKKVGSVWWVQTTSGNWVRSGSTRKLRPAR